MSPYVCVEIGWIHSVIHLFIYLSIVKESTIAGTPSLATTVS